MIRGRERDAKDFNGEGPGKLRFPSGSRERQTKGFAIHTLTHI